MQVAQISDSITHAVLGKKNSVEMGVSDSAALMHIFSTALYTYPMLATVREIICNGWDGHITAGRTGTPLKITISDTMLIIRDFGPGIPDDKIGKIYGTFGESTKREDQTTTGGFGLGSKAPFAYTDNFEVTSHHQGVKTIYSLSKSSMARGGKPSIDTMVQLPTEETGIQVAINLKSVSDRDKFLALVKEVLILGEIPASINGAEPVEVLPLSESTSGYIINSFHGTLTQRINLRYGNVVYPVPSNEHYGEMWDQVNRTMNNLWSSATITFMADPDTVTIAPSREALIFTEGTEETIKQLLIKFNPEKARSSPLHNRQLSVAQSNKIIRQNAPAASVKDLDGQIMLPLVRGSSLTHASGPYAFTVRKAAINHALSSRSLVVGSDALLLRRVKHAINKGTVDKHIGKAFHRASRQYKLACNGRSHHNHSVDDVLQAPLHKHVTRPLLEMVKASNGLIDPEMLHYVDQAYAGHYGKLVKPGKIVLGSASALSGFLFPRVLLARSKKAINDFLEEQRLRHCRSLIGWVVYQLPKHDKHYTAIEQAFTDLGYEVHTFLPARAEREPSYHEDRELAPRKASPKRKGYLALASARDREGKYLLTTAREKCKPEDHVFDPVAYVVLNTSAQSSCDRFADFSVAGAGQIHKLWGKQIAVVTTNQIEKIQAKGVPHVSKYVTQFVDDKLSAAPDFPRYLAFAQHVKQDKSYPTGTDGVIRYMVNHQSLLDSLSRKLRFHVSAETEALIIFFEDDSHYGTRKQLTQCLELAKKIPQSKVLKELRAVSRNSPWHQFLDLDTLGKALRNGQPDSPAMAVPYEIVRNLLK